MKTQLNIKEQNEYELLLWRIRIRLIKFYGSQVNVAKVLGLDPANLSRIFSGVTDCNSKLFFLLLQLSHLVIINDPSEDANQSYFCPNDLV